MKKILLAMMLFCAFAIAKAQNVVLNEVYGNPGGTNSEFVELYNSSISGSLDCYSLLVYYEDGANKGWYVLDLPSAPPIGSAPGFYVLSSKGTFTVQGGTNKTADVNWNDINFRNGSTDGYLEQFQYNGSGGYTDMNLPNTTIIDNLLDGTLNGNQIYITLLFRNGLLINGFAGGSATDSIPGLLSNAFNGNLGTINFPLDCNGSISNISFNFNTMPAIEFFNPSGGNDNGYARSSDGKCGSWVKTAPQVNHTPGTTNGAATGLAGSLNTSAIVSCGEALGDPATRVTSNITGFTGSVNFAEDFAVEVSLYYDNNGDEIINAGDAIHPTVKTVNDTAVATVDTFHVISQFPGQTSWDFILVYRTKRGCFDKVVAFTLNCATLPIKLTSFSAVRNRDYVTLNWQTSMEDNNKGFEIQRKIGMGAWETVGFVPSKPINGDSNTPLTYDAGEINTTKGITQYRLRQIDFDGNHSYSLIRSVRGEGQKGKTIVYPNPSSDGKVNIVFEDANGIRDVSVSDMSGRVIKQMRGVTNNNITIENLNAGFYTVKIVNNETGEQVVQKFVVNKR